MFALYKEMVVNQVRHRLRFGKRQLSAAAVSAAFWACLLILGCSNTLSEPQVVVASRSETMSSGIDNWLSDALRSIPVEYGSTYLWFVNAEDARKAANATDFTGLETLGQGGVASIPWTYDHLFPIDMPGRDYAGAIYDGLGIDLYGLDSILWAGEAHMFGSGTHLTLIQGGFGDDIVERLDLLNYESETHGGVSWQYAWSNYQQRNTLRRSSPFSTEIGRLNAIAPVGDSLLIRRWPDSMPHQIEVHQGIQPSLWDVKPYRELAQVMGNELIAGAFITPSNVIDAWSKVRYTVSPHRNLGYAPELRNWGTLDEHTLAIVGYGVLDDKERIIVALHYADPGKAERNASEMELRLRTLQFHLFGYQDNSRDESLHYPSFTTSCEPFEIRDIRHSDFSVLVAYCTSSDRKYNSPARNLWRRILEYHTVDFLIPDTSRIK